MNEPKTVRVRIAVAVDSDRNWEAVGWSERDDTGAIVPAADDEVGENVRLAVSADCVLVHFIEADVPLPLPPQIVEGKVVTPEEQR